MLDCHAILLLGPTGSGKTPLGEAMERRGIHGCRAVHFDFGAHLRAAVANPKEYPLLTPGEVSTLEGKLRTNALLEDNEFPIAEKIIACFVANIHHFHYRYIILNGIPRHGGQAQAIDALVRVVAVICLDCSAEVVRYRITNDEGGDRSLRNDDSAEEIERKLNVFHDRTLPLLEYYRMCNVPVHSIRIEKDMGVDDVLHRVSLLVP